MLSGDPQQLYPMQVTYNAGQLDFDPAYNGQTVSIVDATGSSDYIIGTDTIPLRSGVSYVVDGVMFSLSGTPKDGDTFSLDWNDGQSGPVGVSDTSNIVLLGKLQNQNTVDGGSANYQAAYTQLVSDVGNRARQLEVTKDAQNSLVSQASAAREAISGVNLDEEAAKLLQFQQMYQASARSISVGQKLFDELLSIAG
jgi:flagellar hook-associated protein 1 FlgK